MEFSLILSATTSHSMYVLFDVGGIRINIAFCQSLRLLINIWHAENVLVGRFDNLNTNACLTEIQTNIRRNLTNLVSTEAFMD